MLNFLRSCKLPNCTLPLAVYKDPRPLRGVVGRTAEEFIRGLLPAPVSSWSEVPAES